MNLWLGAVIALSCSLAGVGFGWRLSRLQAPYWVIGYLIPLALIVACAVVSHVPTRMFVASFSWFTIGMKNFAAFGFISTFLLTTPLSRIPQKRARIMVAV